MAKLSLDAIPFEKISALTLAQRVVIFVGTLLLLGGGYFYLVHMPRSSKISQLKKQHEELKVKLAKAKSAAKSFDVVSKKYKEAQVNLKLALQLLPDKREIPGLLESISRSGRHSGLEFLLFKPSKEVLKDFYAEIPVSIEVNGGYHNLAMFFDKVSRLSRIVNMSNIKIKHHKGGKEAEGRLNATCVATTYRFVEPSKAAAAKKKKKK